MVDSSQATRRYLIIGYGVIPIAINLAITFVLGWLMLRDRSMLHLIGQTPCVLTELLGTNFFLPLITAWITTRVVSKHIDQGRVHRLIEEKDEGWLDRLIGQTRRMIGYGSMTGCFRFSLVVFAMTLVPTFFAVAAWPAETVTLFPFLLAKSLYAALLGALVTPLVAIASLSAVK
ncbi:hypothetical protein [Neorhodopirellula pilleata]|uniref:Uncharacterized protein n=1 Tax=Neorhodopirellula pilleata TaxID=2714738 RepID=A0A5C6AHW7_9BACT|nr:hypothetical protein [Neorhodopirellula pilleata]TWT98996.1 hypothetical protein Pla100_21620 [Neorhodopirellula pilleata]